MVREMKARFAGRCINCPKGIKPGQAILFYGKGRAAHDRCEEAEAAEFEHFFNEGWEGHKNRRMMDAEVARGMAEADHLRDVERFFGPEAAAREELALYLKYGDDY